MGLQSHLPPCLPSLVSLARPPLCVTLHKESIRNDDLWRPSLEPGIQ